MIKLSDIMSEPHLAEAIMIGDVRAQRHPTEPLAILNYTAQAQWQRVWNDVTRQCRGLIYNVETKEVVARPWPKFFNYGEVHGEEGATPLDLERPCRVFDKMDGSLGIAYTLTDGLPMIATRGSFTSEQAAVASLMLHKKYPDWRPDPELTYLFEIIYPDNRIVVDYGGMEDLVLLDILETDTGKPAVDYHWSEMPMPWVDELDAETLGEALELEPRANAEGIVVKFEGSNEMLKIKQEDYIALHRIVTGLNERTVWEHLSGGGTIEELAKTLPEEFQPWVLGVGGNLMGEFLAKQAAALHTHSAIKLLSPPTRKAYASYAKVAGNGLTPLLFMLLDGKDIAPAIWKQLRPVTPKPLMQISENVA